MAENTGIEWATHTFNPFIGCTKVSPACDNCYAEAFAARFNIAEWGQGKPRHRTSASNWKLPIKWNKQAGIDGTRPRVFCASLADVFDNEVPDEWRSDLWALIAATPNLDWLLVTKRIGNASTMLPRDFSAETYPNIWVGITVCNQMEADRDIPKLLALNSVVRFLSVEPILGEISLDAFISEMNCEECRIRFDGDTCPECGREDGKDEAIGFAENACTPYPELHWVICGGESGPNARPTNLGWVRSLRYQCKTSGIPFFFKQWGEYVGGEVNSHGTTYLQNNTVTVCDVNTHYWGNGIISQRVGKKLAGRLLDGEAYSQYPRVRHD